MSFKISGLDGLQKELQDAQAAAAALQGPLEEISLAPDDPASVQAALEAVDRLVDEKAGTFPSGSIAHEILEAMKESMRNSILGIDSDEEE